MSHNKGNLSRLISGILLTVSICWVGQAQSQLSGTYIIDAGGGGDYTSFSKAVRDLDTLGVAGAVTFEVAPGSGPYTEQIAIHQGGSAGAPVVFQGNGEEIRFLPTVNDKRYVIRIDSADYIELRDLVVRVQATASFGWGIHIKGGAEHITIADCLIRSEQDNLFMFSHGAVVIVDDDDQIDWTGGVPAHDVRIEDCAIENWQYGIVMRGEGSNHASGLTIERCTMTDLVFRGIQTIWIDDIVIRDNYIDWVAGAGNTGSNGIALDRGKSPCIIERNILPRTAWKGIWLYAFEGSSADPVRIVNNLVGGQVRENYFLTQGILVTADTAEIHHNTVVHDFGGGRCLEVGGTAIDVRNNSLTSKLGPLPPPFGVFGSALYVPNASCLSALDYNNYYAEGGNYMATIGGTNYSDLASIQADLSAPAGHDTNSISVENMTFSATDIHETGTGLDGMALPGLATIDVDGEPRSLSPDIGADEYTPIASNAGAGAIVSPVSGSPGIQNVRVRIKNTGSVTLTSVEVSAQITSDRTGNTTTLGPLSITGVSLAPDDLATINLGPFDFQTARYDLKAWTSMPNGSADQVPSDDTVEVAGLVICDGFAGNYVVDQGGSNTGNSFADMQYLVDLINSCGMAGPITIEIAPGSGPYTGQVVVSNLSGNSATNTLTINGNGEIYTYAPTSVEQGFIWMIQGIDYVTIDNIELICAPGAVACWNLAWNNSSQYMTVRNSTFRNRSAVGSNLNWMGIGMSATIGAIFGPGSFSALIENNVFDRGSRGILGSASSCTYRNNEFINTEYAAIELFNGSNALVEGNRIDLSGLVSGGSGIRMTDISSSIVQGNEVYGFGSVGIYLDNINSFGDTLGLVANNILAGDNSAGGTTVGIQIDGTQGSQIWHNSVRISGGSSFGSGYGFWSSSFGGTPNIDLANNIFDNGSGSGAAMRISAWTDLPQRSNYNLLRSDSTDLCSAGSNSYADLASWITGTGMDINSLSADPLYVSDLDLHLQAGSPCIDVGLAGLASLDIDGELRPDALSSLADMGADEYGSAAPACPTPVNAGVLVLGSTSATLTWDVVPEAVAYHVQGRKAGIGGPKSIVVTTNTPMFSFFEPNTSYEWRVRSLCAVDTSAFTTILSFTTLSSREGIFGLQVGPVPASDLLQITGFLNQAETVDVMFYGMNGRLLRSGSAHGTPGQWAVDLDLSQLPPALYQLEVRKGSDIERRSIAVIR